VRLVHFRDSPEPFPIESRSQQVLPIRARMFLKPSGFWVSDEDEFGWSEWCRGEEFHLEALRYAFEVTIKPDANVLLVSGADNFLAFHERFAVHDLADAYYSVFDKGSPDWVAVAEQFQGIVITPYLWEFRLSGYDWYYGWDCASGCIWDAEAIGSVTLLRGELNEA